MVGDGETDVAHARILDQLPLRHRRCDADGLRIFWLLFLVEVREHDILALCTANAHVLVTQCLVLRPADIAPVVLAVPADGVSIHEAVRLLPQIDDTDRALCARVQVFQQCMKGRDGELCASRERQGVQSLTRGGVVRVDTELRCVCPRLERRSRRAEIVRQLRLVARRRIDAPDIAPVVCIRIGSRGSVWDDT